MVTNHKRTNQTVEPNAPAYFSPHTMLGPTLLDGNKAVCFLHGRDDGRCVKRSQGSQVDNFGAGHKGN